MSEINRRHFLGTAGAAAITAGTVTTAGIATGPTIALATEPAAPSIDVRRATIRRSGDMWTLENDVVRIGLRTRSGRIELMSVYNKAAAKEYLTGPGKACLFSYELDGADTVTAIDGGWSFGEPELADVVMHSVDGVTAVGRSISFRATRRAPRPMRVTLVFELYDGRSGLRYHTLIRNDAATDLTISNSTVVALNFPDQPHTIFYPPNMVWKSTTGPLSPLPADTSSSGKSAERPKKAITVYDSGDGWSLSPELNWKTQKGNGNYSDYMLPPFAGINAWYEIDHVEVATNPQSLQLVLFAGEEFEYLSVNLTVFAGDVVDGKMAEQEHFRRRFRFNHVSTLLDTNDWGYRGGPGRVLPQDYYYTTIIPKARQAGIDMVMLDDLWNSTRDTIVPSADMAKSIGSLGKLSSTLLADDLKFGLWFDLTGDAANKGRDLADPANIAFKRGQIETLLTKYHLNHHMIDLTEYWQNEEITAYSHPTDNVYRKAVLVRTMLNALVEKHPFYLPKLTSELDISPTQGDRNVGLIHLAYNGWNTPDGGITGEALTLRTAVSAFGHLPMEATYTGGVANGTMEDHYAMMACRNAKFADDPGDPAKWPEDGIRRLAQFNAWRKSPRIRAMTEQLFRPVYLGTGWDGPTWNSSTGPFVWLYADEPRTSALLIASASTGYASSVVADLRWLDGAKRYAVADITQDDDGSHTYAFRGCFTGTELRKPGLAIDLTENTAPGKAFWIQEVSGRKLQVCYLDEHITSCRPVGASGTSIGLRLAGTPSSTVTVIVVDPVHNTAAAKDIRLNATGAGTAVVRAAELTPPVPAPTIFPEPTYFEAELLPYAVTPSAVVVTPISEGNASNGSWILAQFTAVGQSISYTVDVPSDGMYRIDVRYKENQSRGKSQARLDGAELGPEVNHYYPANMYKDIEFRERYLDNRQMSAGKHTLTFTSTGTSGTSYQVGVDYMKITPTATRPQQQFEAETVYHAASGTASTVADPGASPAEAGAYHSLPATAVGDWAEYIIPVAAAGSYRITTVARSTAAGGQAQLWIDGTAQGELMDEYLAPSDGKYWYEEFDNGTRTFDAAGDRTLRYTVAGKNAASTSYALAADYFILTLLPRLALTGPTTVVAGHQLTLTVDYLDMEPYYSKPEYLLWTIDSGQDVVTVDQTGVVTGLKAGAAVVRVRSQISRDAQTTATVTVT